MANVTEQRAITDQAYRLLGVPERLAHDAFEGEHMWHGEYALPWLDRWLARQVRPPSSNRAPCQPR